MRLTAALSLRLSRLVRFLTLTLLFSLAMPVIAQPVSRIIQVDTTGVRMLSPDGGYIVWECQPQAPFCLYDVATDTNTPLLPDASLSYSNQVVAISEEANVIAFFAGISGQHTHDQLYVYDRVADVVEPITLLPDGTQRDGGLSDYHLVLTPDGRFILFDSWIAFDPDDSNEANDLYVYDRQLGTFDRIPNPVDPACGSCGIAGFFDISDDGNRVAANFNERIYVYDRTLRTYEIATVNSNGNLVADAGAEDVVISGDGNVVAFVAVGVDGGLTLDPDKTSDQNQVFMRILDEGRTFMVSDTPDGSEPLCSDDIFGPHNCVSNSPGLSIDYAGTSLIFEYNTSNSDSFDVLIPEDINEAPDVFVYRHKQDRIDLISLDENESQFFSTPIPSTDKQHLSNNGVFAVFEAEGAVYLRDQGDIEPPEVTSIATVPDPLVPGQPLEISAIVNDAETGGTNIASAEFSFDGGEWQSMLATDGAFDSTSEDVKADVSVAPSSVDELCVRGTDALGWTSDPECISIDVGTDFVGLLVRCMHRPLYPQEGDLIEVTAQALDSEGAPVIADEVQIYINDKQNPVQSILGTDGEIAANVLSDGEDIFYGCQAIRGTEKAFSRYVTVDIGDPLIPGFPAIPVLYHGAMSEKIDLVFFAELDSYPEGTLSEDFLEDLYGVIREGLFDIPWFVRWQYVLNVWIAREEVDVTPRAVPGQAEPLCASEKPNRYGKKYSFGDAVGIIHVEDCRDMAIPLRPFTTRYRPARLQVVAHEIGHKAFSLADEYVTSSTVRYSISPEPNLFPTLNGCMQAADERGYDPDECRLLPGGLLNTNGRYIFEPDYRNVDDPFSETGDLMQQTGNAACAADPEDVCERYRIGDSERARVFWKLAKCIAGEC